MAPKLSFERHFKYFLTDVNLMPVVFLICIKTRFLFINI